MKPKQYLLKGNEVKHATKEVGAINLSKVNVKSMTTLYLASNEVTFDMAYAHAHIALPLAVDV